MTEARSLPGMSGLEPLELVAKRGASREPYFETRRRKSGFNQQAQLRAPFKEITVTVTEAPGEPEEDEPSGADLRVVKTAREMFVDCEFEDTVFDITVTNLGPSTATGVTLIDTIPSGIGFESSYSLSCPGATLGPLIGTCPIGTLPPGGVFEVIATLEEDACSVEPGARITNSVRVVSDNDPNSANNVSSAFSEVQFGEFAQGRTSFTSTLTPLAPEVTSAQAVVRLNRESTWNVGARMHRHTGRALKATKKSKGCYSRRFRVAQAGASASKGTPPSFGGVCASTAARFSRESLAPWSSA